MKIAVIIERVEGGGFRARAGEPFNASAEGDSADSAKQRLEAQIRQRLQNGITVATIDIGNGPAEPHQPLRLEPLPEDDWFFRTMRDAIEENRRREDEAGA